MTAAQLHEGVLQYLDKTSSLVLPELIESEIDFWLNQGQDMVIRFYLFGMAESVEQKMEPLQTGVSRLKNLVTTTTAQAPNPYSAVTNANLFNFAADHMHYVSSIATCNRILPHGKAVSGIKVKVEIIDYNDRMNFAQVEGINKPNFNKVYGWFEDNKFACISDAYTTKTGLEITYIKKPDVISKSGNITSSLPEDLHPELIRQTADLLVKNFGSDRIQPMDNILKSGR